MSLDCRIGYFSWIMDANLEILLINFWLGVLYGRREDFLTTLNVMRELNKFCCLVLISVICTINSVKLSLFYCTFPIGSLNIVAIQERVHTCAISCEF